MYEAGVRVPMAIRWPGHIPPGQEEQRLVSSIDLLPTVLEAANIPAPDYALPGDSLLAMMRGEPVDDWRRYLFCVHEGSFAMTYAPQRSVRDERYKLIVNLLPERENQLCTWYYAQRHAMSCPSAEELAAARPEVQAGYATWAQMPHYELYDLQADPYEWTNLADDPEHAEVKDRLIDAYEDWQRRTDDPLADPDKLAQLTAEFDDLVERYGEGLAYRRNPDFTWGYLEYLNPDPARWTREWSRNGDAP